MKRLRQGGKDYQNEKLLALTQKDPDNLVRHHIDSFIGHGVFTKTAIVKGSPILCYTGDLISRKEAERRSNAYAKQNFGCFIFDLHFNGKRLSIDATLSSRLGRFVNDSPPNFNNCLMKQYVINHQPQLILVAKRDIVPYEELRYSYNDENLLWREKPNYCSPFMLPSEVVGSVDFVISQRTEDKGVIYLDMHEKSVITSSDLCFDEEKELEEVIIKNYST